MIDARGVSCPEPLLMLKKAMAGKEAEYIELVDSRVAVENITRFAGHQGYAVSCTEIDDYYQLTISKK
ncbi:MAG: sulfurtransferase TusA family protein [Bacillota bacterium]|nr:sulfurtransferase TusA family protein [Bacillota bacterium]